MGVNCIYIMICIFINPRGRIPRVYPWMNVNSPEGRRSPARKMERCHGLAGGVSINGFWTEYVNRPDWLLHRIPDNVTFKEATLTEPLTVVVYALCENTHIKPDDVVLIQGCGTIGLLAGMLAKTLGAYKVIINGTDVDKKYCLPVARKLGFDKVINVSERDLKEEIMLLTKGFGVDIVVEASGSEEAINSAVDLVKKKGSIIAISEASNPKISFPWNKAIFSACSLFLH